MRLPLLAFGIATFLPILLLIAATVLGGIWVVLALAYMTAIAFALDEVFAPLLSDADDADLLRASEIFCAVLAVCHFALLGAAIWVLSQAHHLSVAEKMGLFFAYGLFFGQVSNSNAHELIHRSRKVLFLFGKWVFISLLFGHHTSAHRLVHHQFVATTDDPNSAPLGMDFYRFAPRAWWGSFRAGLAVENTRRRTKHIAGGFLAHPYFQYIGGAVLTILAAALIGGFGGVLALFAIAGYAQMQLLLSDYVQHYGLIRLTLPGGKLEPVTTRHSWNAGHWFTSLLMLNAPRHSEHHIHPARPFPELSAVADRSPALPRSLPVMAMIALYPPRWRKLMDKRAEAWNARGQRSHSGAAGTSG